MQTRNRLLDDVARVANGATGVFSGLKGEVEGLVKDRLEKILVEMDLVPREEFEVVKAMAIKARAENEALLARIEALETAQKKPTAKKTRAAKPAKAD
ncbi:accessory factor UbiK family protein [Aestuariispira insulae]|uniref:BMFP domain-containing protein YqiC n=1 Tax=Aestuariispira insulae TaxID=1461337 RepID=A0A3D9HXS2_9PROT|nr:accessory factor UbiK family protein [Aestuariispira insulae]RED54302.1 hypothetical protein DFP90_1011105 [Aestuariispira insulae]